MTPRSSYVVSSSSQMSMECSSRKRSCDEPVIETKRPRYTWYFKLESESSCASQEDTESVYSIQNQETGRLAPAHAASVAGLLMAYLQTSRGILVTRIQSRSVRMIQIWRWNWSMKLPPITTRIIRCVRAAVERM